MAKSRAPTDIVHMLYPTVADPSADKKRRSQETRRLQQVANVLRHVGLPEDENPASAYLRAAGIRRHEPRIDTLRAVGLPAEFLCSEPVLKVPEAARVLALLVDHSGKHPDAISGDDAEAFLSRPRDSLKRGTRPMQRERYLLKRAVRLYDAFAGNVRPNPVTTRPWFRRIDRSSFGPACQRDAEQLDAHMTQSRFTAATTRTVEGVFYAAARYVGTLGVDHEAYGVFWLLEDTDRAKAFALSHFAPREDDTPRSVSGLAGFFHCMRSSWLAGGASPIVASDRMTALKRALRNGNDRGRYIALTLRSADPSPAPSEKQVTRARLWYATEITELRTRGKAGRVRLDHVVQERNIMETPLRTGMRWATEASCRADTIVYDEATESLYVDEVVVKANRRRQRLLVPEKQIGTVTISRWYLDPELLEMYEEALQLDGYSLFAYLRTRDRSALPWVIARDDTFGPHMRGQLVSPLWRGGRHGYLSKAAIGDILGRITRERLGLQSGRGHPLRRYAALYYAPLADKYPAGSGGHPPDGPQHVEPVSELRRSQPGAPLRVGPSHHRHHQQRPGFGTGPERRARSDHPTQRRERPRPIASIEPQSASSPHQPRRALWCLERRDARAGSGPASKRGAVHRSRVRAPVAAPSRRDRGERAPRILRPAAGHRPWAPPSAAAGSPRASEPRRGALGRGDVAAARVPRRPTLQKRVTQGEVMRKLSGYAHDVVPLHRRMHELEELAQRTDPQQHDQTDQLVLRLTEVAKELERPLPVSAELLRRSANTVRGGPGFENEAANDRLRLAISWIEQAHALVAQGDPHDA